MSSIRDGNPETPARPAVDGPSERHGWYAVGVFFLVGLYSYIDRAILSILQVPVKKELGLSDSQLGLLTGLAFALFFSVLGLPVARLADRTVRKNILAVALTIWSVMTAACGFAGSFATLLFLRIGVAVGEAGSVAPVHSMISDYFPRHKRTTAMAVWSLCISGGTMLAFLLGGWLSVLIGWRHTMTVIGLSGLLLVPLVLFTVREPPRGRFDGVAPGDDPAVQPSLLTTIATFWRLKTFRYLCLGGGFMGYAANAILVWNAPFYSRVHHMPLGEIALYLALFKGVGGGAGVALGGWLAQRYGRHDQRWYMLVPAIAALILIPFAIAQYFVPWAGLSLALAVIPAIASTAYLAPINAVQQSIAPANMRAFASATMALATSLIGLGFGPTAVGITSDLLIHFYGLEQTSLRWAIPLQMVGAVIAAIFFQRASVHLVTELAPMRDTTGEAAVQGSAG